MTAAQLEQVHPPLPSPLSLEDEPWVVEQGKLTLSPDGFEVYLRNKTRTARWIEEAMNLLNFYRSRDHPEPLR